jgi:outer membrane receptor protein involved in Fe transport
VLVNGRRHVSSSEGSNEVDVNTIPTDLIDRVDVVTGGNSAIYGSDAIGGVVNFVLRRNFDGLQIRAQDGISSSGDGNAYFVSATGGRNFADGRGNAAVSAGICQAGTTSSSVTDASIANAGASSSSIPIRPDRPTAATAFPTASSCPTSAAC